MTRDELSTSHYYRVVAFRPEVEHVIGERRAVFTYDLVTFDVDLNAAAAGEVERLCAALRMGLSTDEVAHLYPAFEPHVWHLLDAFDRYGLVRELAPFADLDAITGPLFWRQVEAFANRVKFRCRPVLYEALLAGTVTRESLVRYVLEYFHLVSAGPAIIAGSLAHEARYETRSLLDRFLQQEIGHDQMLLRSLLAVGITEERARDAIPLPETFALITSLQTLADHDPLSFKALVFLLEEANPEFHGAFVDACGGVGLDEAFWQPVVDHGGINDDGDHGSISKKLLEYVDVVSAEERVVVLKNVATLIGSLVAFERAVLAGGIASDAA